MLASNRLRTGVLALAGLIILVGAATIRSRPFIRYEYWRLSHGLLAILVAVLTLQHVLAVGTYSADYPLRAVWFLFAFVAVTAVGLVYFSHNRHIEQKCFTVALVRPTGVSLWRQSGRAWTELLLPNFTKCETARPI
jgi:predicted ferric reductase